MVAPEAGGMEGTWSWKPLSSVCFAVHLSHPHLCRAWDSQEKARDSGRKGVGDVCLSF